MTTAELSPFLRPVLRLMAAGLIVVSSAAAIANGPPPHAAAHGAAEGKGQGKSDRDRADRHDRKDHKGHAAHKEHKEHKGHKGHKGDPDHARVQRGEPSYVQRSIVIDPQPGAVFTPRHRDVVGRYYHTEYARKCPPGLAKKNNGCMPPGQARKYAVGNRLPGDVVLYPVPQPVIVQLPAVPPGYRYARVGNDIVLLSPGTALVVDIISAF